jgi:hypothetical protein
VKRKDGTLYSDTSVLAHPILERLAKPKLNAMYPKLAINTGADEADDNQ